MATKPSPRDPIVCPHCGRKGTVLKVWDDNSIDVDHGSAKRLVQSAATGQWIECGVFIDGCSAVGKLGEVGRRKIEPTAESESLEEDF